MSTQGQNDSTIKHYDKLAEKRHYWKNRNKYYYIDQENYFRFLIPEDSSILELGCGTGDLLNALHPKRGVGVDISPQMIQIANKNIPT